MADALDVHNLDGYWDVKVYDEDGERETLRGRTYAQMETLMGIFERENVKAKAMHYTHDGEFVHGDGRSVNWDKYRGTTAAGGSSGP